MGWDFAAKGLHVCNGKVGRTLAGNILIDITAQTDVYELYAAADTENWFLGFHGKMKQRQFQIVSPDRNITAVGMCFFAKMEGMDVRTAAEQKGIKQGDKLC